MAPALPPGWLHDTLAMYRRAFSRGALLAVRNWPVGLVVVMYGALLGVVRALTAPLGLAGGLILYLATVACMSSWLSLVAEVIRSGRIRMRDLPSGFGTYLNELLTAGFLLWGLFFLASILLSPLPFLHIVFLLATMVFFNALPELIYLGRHSPPELLLESYRFIGENWIEWFPANMLLGALVVASRALPEGPYGVVVEAGTGLVLYFAMIVRGLLFLELASSSRRAREFKRRAAG